MLKVHACEIFNLILELYWSPHNNTMPICLHAVAAAASDYNTLRLFYSLPSRHPAAAAGACLVPIEHFHSFP